MKSLGGFFEKFEHANAQDFRQRYINTFGFFRNDDKPPLLVKIMEVNDQVQFVDHRGVPFSLRPDRPGNVGFEFLPPKSALHNTREGVAYTERIASRQWSRGVCDRNTKIYLLNEHGWGAGVVNFQTLLDIYSNPITPKESLGLYLSGKREATALSPSFAINKERLYVLAAHVGYVNAVSATKLNVKFINDESLWLIELQDACKKLGLELEVTT